MFEITVKEQGHIMADPLKLLQKKIAEWITDYHIAEGSYREKCADELKAMLPALERAIAERVAEERERALARLVEVESIVEFYLKREIESPANHQEFAREAEAKLMRFRSAIRALEGTDAK